MLGLSPAPAQTAAPTSPAPTNSAATPAIPPRATAVNPATAPMGVPGGVIVHWYGHGFIYLTSSFGIRCAIDPFGSQTVHYQFPQHLAADFVLVTHEGEDAGAADQLFGDPLIFRSVMAVGLNRANGIPFYGIAMQKDPDGQGVANTAFTVKFDGIKFCSLGQPYAPLLTREKEQFATGGKTDVLFLPVGTQSLGVADLDQIALDLGAKMIIPVTYKTDLSGSLTLRPLEDYLAGDEVPGAQDQHERDRGDEGLAAGPADDLLPQVAPGSGRTRAGQRFRAMKILLIGSGGREHAMAWRLRQDDPAVELFIAPGNAGTAQLGTNLPLGATDLDGLVAWAAKEKPDLTIVGPEAPLCAGVVDRFEAAGLAIFGPNAAAARLEGSKVFTKEILLKHGLPTAGGASFTDSKAAAEYLAQRPSYPQVLKADGLAAGKGVIIADTPAEAAAALGQIMDLRVFGDAGNQLVIEDFMAGREMSVHVLTDGISHVILPISQDHKKLGDDDTGLNTGGMGAYAPAPFATAELQAEIAQLVVEPTLAAFRAEGIDFRGILFIGLIWTKDGPSILEFNVRGGDPRRRCFCRCWMCRWWSCSRPCASAGWAKVPLRLNAKHAVTVVLAAAGYPERRKRVRKSRDWRRNPRNLRLSRGHEMGRREGGRGGRTGAQRDRLGRRSDHGPGAGLPAGGKNSFCRMSVSARYCRSTDSGMKIIHAISAVCGLRREDLCPRSRPSRPQRR